MIRAKKIIFNLACFALAMIAMIFMLKGRKMTEGIELENMDRTVNPADDFYDFATRGWRDKNPLTPEYSRFGTFDKLGQDVLEQVRVMVEEIAGKPSGALQDKIAKIYNGAMNYGKRNVDDIAPVLAEFEEIDKLFVGEAGGARLAPQAQSIAAYLGRAQKTGSPFWGDGVAVDAKDSSHYIFGIGQGGLGLSRDYLLDDDVKSKEIRGKYKRYMSDVFKMFGISDAPAEAVYDLEIEMARSFYPKEKLRDPIANYHKMALTEIKQRFAPFDWDAYFAARGITPDWIDVGQPEPLANSIAILKSKDLGVLKAYLKWSVANGAMTVLGDRQYDLSFDFYGRVLSGKEERRQKWKDAVNLTESVLGEAVGKMYVKKYFPPAAKKRMADLVENLRLAYGDRIRSLYWMTGAVKSRALEKLGAFRVKIGYPDKWRDYSDLEIRGDSLYADLKRAEIFEDDFMLEKLRGRDVDRTLWHMSAHEVNAYYDPSQNEICFPAGILQPPFFDMSADDAFNYGAIGSIIGHEMTHGFDDSGRHFDAKGNMTDWWDEESATEFEARAKVMKEYFDKIEVAPGLPANGEFTLGENLADYGGLTISFDAFKKFGSAESAGGFSPDQRFFIAYAGTEAGNIRPEEIIRRTKTDEHSLSVWRVNGILPHVDAWHDAWRTAPENKMYLAPDKRCRLW